MADEQQVQSYLIGLGRGRNGFFCPESRFHLMGGVKPQAEWPAAAPLTQAVIVGLRAGSLRDLRNNIPSELLLSKKEIRELAAKAGITEDSDDEDFIMDDDADKDAGGNQPPANDGNTDGNADGNDDGKTDDDDQQDGNSPDGDKLTEEQIDELGKKDLLAFIKKNEIDMEVLDLNSRSNEGEIKDALKIHFGYKRV